MTDRDKSDLIRAAQRYGAACRMQGRAMEAGDHERTRQATKAKDLAWDEYCHLAAGLTHHDPVDPGRAA